MDDMKKRLWEARIREQGNSGLSIVAWCSQNKITKQSFYYWRKRVEQETGTLALPVFAEMEIRHQPTQAPIQTAPGLSVTWENLHFTVSCARDIQLAAQLIWQLKML